MLLSMKIQLDSGFERDVVKNYPKEKKHLMQRWFLIFKQIVRDSVKVIVPEESLQGSEDGVLIGDMQLYDQKGDTSDEIEKRNRFRDQKMQLYRQYSKLPFDSVFFESKDCGCLCIMHGQKLTIIPVKKFAGHWMIHWKMDCDIQRMDADGAEDQLSGKYRTEMADMTGFYDPQQWITDPDRQEEIDRQLEELFQKTASAIFRDTLHMKWQVLELLLHMNVANKNIHRYSLKVKEAKGLGKSILPLYEYRILDIFRERKSYESVKDIEDAMSTKLDVQQRRAHLVRGHFKNKNGKLFWWNPFMRNRKNASELGTIEKDYRVV